MERARETCNVSRVDAHRDPEPNAGDAELEPSRSRRPRPNGDRHETDADIGDCLLANAPRGALTPELVQPVLENREADARLRRKFLPRLPAPLESGNHCRPEPASFFSMLHAPETAPQLRARVDVVGRTLTRQRMCAISSSAICGVCPMACLPQAPAAGSPFQLLALLGLRVSTRAGDVRFENPVLA